MARMYARKKGKSGSHKPPRTGKPEWVDYDKDEIEKLVDKLSSEGKRAAEIGIILRDQYGIPSVRYMDLRLSKMVPEKYNKPVPEDLYNLMVKVVALHAHMNKNKKDGKNRHALELVESKIRRIGKYYVRQGKLQKNWKYSIEQAKLLVR